MGLRPESSLTEWESAGINAEHNLADGHAHHSLPADLTANVLLELFNRATIEPQEVSERRFLGLFRDFASEPGLPSSAILHYSSSLSIEVVGKALWEMGVRTVGLPTPTFDNIPLLLKRCGLQLIAIREDLLSNSDIVRQWVAAVDAVFVVQPNNPSGYVMDRSEWQSLIGWCAEKNVVYCCDSSFRFFDSRCEWSQYAYLKELSATESLRYFLVEDSGKTWPLCELKVGILTPSADLFDVARPISDEVMLNVSPFTLNLLSFLMRRPSGRASSLQELRSLVLSNRRYLRDALFGLAEVVSHPASKVSVEWLKLPDGCDSHQFCLYCADQGIVVLPGRPFGWDEPTSSAAHFRVALMRDEVRFKAGVDALRTALVSFFRE